MQAGLFVPLYSLVKGFLPPLPPTRNPPIPSLLSHITWLDWLRTADKVYRWIDFVALF